MKIWVIAAILIALAVAGYIYFAGRALQEQPVGIMLRWAARLGREAMTAHRRTAQSRTPARPAIAAGRRRRERV